MAANGENTSFDTAPRLSYSDELLTTLGQQAIHPGELQEPFGDQQDELDFAYLMGIDDRWSSLLSGETATIEEMENAEYNRRVDAVLEHPLFPDHVVGYLYSRVDYHQGWVNSGQIANRLCRSTLALTITQQTQLMTALGSLVEHQRIDKERGSFRVNKHCMQEEFYPELDQVFFDWTTKYLQKRGGRGRSKYIVLSYFGDSITPQEFWSGMRYLRQKEDSGELEYCNDDGHIVLPAYEAPEKIALLDSLDTVLAQEPGLNPFALEKAMRKAGLVKGNRRVKGNWIGARGEH